MSRPQEMDPRFQVRVIAQTPDPQKLVWVAMHQDYAEGFAADDTMPSERECGEIAVKRLLSGDRGHYGPLEHPQISFACGYFPHSVMQQARTHRVGVSFDVQSGRYTGKRVVAAARNEVPMEDVFYLRPEGTYKDRQGHRYDYTVQRRAEDLDHLKTLAWHYLRRTDHSGFAEEHARGMLAFDVRQHFVVSFNLRSLLHFLDLRSKADAQLEIQQLCDLMWPHVLAWVPEIAGWYQLTRLGRARLAP